MFLGLRIYVSRAINYLQNIQKKKRFEIEREMDPHQQLAMGIKKFGLNRIRFITHTLTYTFKHIQSKRIITTTKRISKFF